MDLTAVPRLNVQVRRGFMAAHPMGSGSAMPPSEWHSSGHVYTRGQLMSLVRAGIIALILLGVLAAIVLM
jgi:hypothetical protein